MLKKGKLGLGLVREKKNNKKNGLNFFLGGKLSQGNAEGWCWMMNMNDDESGDHVSASKHKFGKTRSMAQGRENRAAKCPLTHAELEPHSKRK